MDDRPAQGKVITAKLSGTYRALVTEVTRAVAFDPKGWRDYLYWQPQDRRTLKRINQLSVEVVGDPFTGIGKPEALEHILTGAWSRRIDQTNRLVYFVTPARRE